MYNDPNRGAQGVSVPENMPPVTFVRGYYDLSHISGSVRMRLPRGSATTLLCPGGLPLNGLDRCLMSAHAGPSFVVLSCDERRAGPDRFDADTLSWAVKRSDRALIWGCAAWPAAVAYVEKFLALSKRAVIVMCDARTEGEWVDAIEGMAPEGVPVQAMLTDDRVPPGMLGRIGTAPWKGGVQ